MCKPRRHDGGVDEEYVDAVLSMVEQIPTGRTMSYGAIAEEVGVSLRRGGPRQVARVLATFGGAVPWWRVVTADGRLPPGKEVAARRLLAAEGCPIRGDGSSAHVEMAVAAWRPCRPENPARPPAPSRSGD